MKRANCEKQVLAGGLCVNDRGKREGGGEGGGQSV